MRGRGAAAPADKCAEKHCGEHACMHHELQPEGIYVVFFYEHRYDEHNGAYDRTGYCRGIIRPRIREAAIPPASVPQYRAASDSGSASGSGSAVLYAANAAMKSNIIPAASAIAAPAAAAVKKPAPVSLLLFCVLTGIIFVFLLSDGIIVFGSSGSVSFFILVKSMRADTKIYPTVFTCRSGMKYC